MRAYLVRVGRVSQMANRQVFFLHRQTGISFANFGEIATDLHPWLSGQTDRQTDPTTVTLATHARRGLTTREHKP